MSVTVIDARDARYRMAGSMDIAPGKLAEGRSVGVMVDVGVGAETEGGSARGKPIRLEKSLPVTLVTLRGPWAVHKARGFYRIQKCKRGNEC